MSPIVNPACAAPEAERATGIGLWTPLPSGQTPLASATWVTVREIVLGFALAVVVALALAILIHFSALLRRGLLPILVLSQTVPTVLLAPILAILFGFGLTPKLIVVAVVCFFPIVVNAVDGLRSTDAELVRMMRTLDADRAAIFRVHLARRARDPEAFQLEELAAASDGFSGAEIEAAVKSALLDGYLDGARQLTTADVLRRVRSIRPTSEVKREDIADLRRWAQEHLAIDAVRGETASGERLLEF
jgi:hypothetical protein